MFSIYPLINIIAPPLAGAAAGLILGKLTDKQGKRAYLIAPIICMMAAP